MSTKKLFSKPLFNFKDSHAFNVLIQNFDANDANVGRCQDVNIGFSQQQIQNIIAYV